jgi:hypothetical protein
MNATTYGLDVAKRVFQMYWVEAQTAQNALHSIIFGWGRVR